MKIYHSDEYIPQCWNLSLGDLRSPNWPNKRCFTNSGCFRPFWYFPGGVGGLVGKKSRIHLTGAATNPWITFESHDSLIKFEIWTNLSNMVQFYSTLLLHILHFLTLSIFSGQKLFTSDYTYNIQLLTPNFNFTSISNFKFNFKIQF